jgi:gamma-glutamyltranspeptidase/glutathione hydrolase
MAGYPTDPSMFASFPSRRSVVHSTKGIVATANPYATEAGLRILREGGNAADAAIAAAAVLNLVDPSMTGLGGDAFALFYDAKTRKVHAVNGSGRSASKATIDGVCDDLGIGEGDRVWGVIPTGSAHAVTVPGAAACWVDLVERFGSGRVFLGDVLAPAIELAEEGVVISEISSQHVSLSHRDHRWW